MQKNILRLAAVVLTIALIGLVAGCSGNDTAKETGKNEEAAVEPLTAEIKADKSSAKAGEKITYTMTIENTTNDSLKGVKMIMVVPKGLQAGLSQSGGPKPVIPKFDETAMSYTWSVGTLEAGQSFWFDAEMDILPDAQAGSKISAVFTAEAGGYMPIEADPAVTEIN